jgi:hypothetical protein
MRHATIFDAFQAAAGLGNQVLDRATYFNRYVRDKDLFDSSIDFNEQENKIVQAREMVYDDGGINYKNVKGYPETFQEYADGVIQDWKTKWENKYAGRYYSDNLHEIENRGKLAIQQTILAANTEYEKQKINAEYDDEINKIFNNPQYDAQQKREMAFRWTEYTRGSAGWDRETYERKTDGYLARVLKEELQFTPENNITIEAIENRYRGLREDGTYARLNGAGEAIETAKEGAVQAQWAFNFKGLQELDAAYDTAVKNYHTAVQTGDAARVKDAYTAMMSLYRAGKPKKDAALDPKKKASEYNTENRPQIMTMFPDPPGYDDGQPKKKLSQSDIDRHTAHLVQLVFDQYFGDARDEEGYRLTLTIPEAYMALGDFLESGGMTVPEREFKQWFDNEFIRRVEREPGSNPAAGFISMLLTNPLSVNTPKAKEMTGYTDNEKENQKTAVDQLNADYQNRALNLVANIGLLPGNQKHLQDAVQELKNSYIGELSVILDSNLKLGSSSTIQDTGNYKNMSKALEWIEKSPVSQIEDRKGGSSYGMINDDSIMAYKQVAASFLTDKLNEKGISLVNIDRDGRIVTGYDREGNAYRIRGMEKEMPKTGGGKIDRTVLVIEQKAGDEWKELEELTEEQLGSLEAFVERLREFNQGGPHNPENDDFKRKREQRRLDMQSRGINWQGIY